MQIFQLYAVKLLSVYLRDAYNSGLRMNIRIAGRITMKLRTRHDSE